MYYRGRWRIHLMYAQMLPFSNSNIKLFCCGIFWYKRKYQLLEHENVIFVCICWVDQIIKSLSFLIKHPFLCEVGIPLKKNVASFQQRWEYNLSPRMANYCKNRPLLEFRLVLNVKSNERPLWSFPLLFQLYCQALVLPGQNRFVPFSTGYSFHGCGEFE